MTPEGRRRKARKVLSRVLLAHNGLDIATEDFRKLCTDVGITPPALASLVEARKAASVAAVQLRQLMSGLERAAKKA